MRKKGFTLIELIVIIAVLAIIVTIGVPRFLGQTKEASLTKLKHDARIVQDACDRYYYDHNDWPYLLDENGNPVMIQNPEEYRDAIIHKIEYFEDEKLGTNPNTNVVLYEIDFNKLKPYIKRLDSNPLLFLAARGNPDFGVIVLDPKSKITQDRINTIASNKPVAVITMTPSQGITTDTIIQWSYESSYDPNGLEIVDAEWEGKQDKYETEGEYVVKLRVQNSAGIWSDWVEIKFYVIDAKDIVQISAGRWHTLALKKDGTVWAWGYNFYGQLGDGTTAHRDTPVQVENLENITSISAGSSHSLALKSDGTVWAWGRNNHDQLGDGTTENRHAPVQVQFN